MFPDPFKKMDEKMDKRFTELMKSMDELKKSIDSLTKEMKEFREASNKKER